MSYYIRFYKNYKFREALFEYNFTIAKIIDLTIFGLYNTIATVNIIGLILSVKCDKNDLNFNFLKRKYELSDFSLIREKTKWKYLQSHYQTYSRICLNNLVTNRQHNRNH